MKEFSDFGERILDGDVSVVGNISFRDPLSSVHLKDHTRTSFSPCEALHGAKEAEIHGRG
jgi:hypothetical protein